MNNQNQGYPAGGQNPFAYQAPPPKKNTKVIIALIIVIVFLLGAVTGIIVWKLLSEQEEADDDKEQSPKRIAYVVKSKVTAANSASSSLYNAINTVLTELDEEGIDTRGIKEISYSKGDERVEIIPSDHSMDIDEEAFYKSLKEYFADVSKLDFKAACKNGICIAVASKQDSTYTGTKPTIVTKDNYEEYSDDLDKALEDTMEKWLG